jgi:predicted O-methyltransferase YrrM
VGPGLARARAIDGWMSDAELRWLANAARSCRLIVEVGCYKGRSTRALADHCPGVVYAVDPWDGGYLNDDDTQARWLDTRKARLDFERNLADHLKSGRVIQVISRFDDAMPRLEREVGTGRADLVFIDGDHRYEAVLEDIALARQLVRPGGTLGGHDYTHPSWPGVKQAVAQAYGSTIRLCSSIWWVTA